MPRKRAIWWMAEAIRLDGEGRSSREIADILRFKTKQGQKVPGQSTIWAKLRDLRNGVAAPPAVPTPQPPSPPPEPKPLDKTPMPAEEVVGNLTGLLREQTARAQQLGAEGDHQGAQRATRMAATLAAILVKTQASDAEDGDTVRVKASEMQAAADRAVQGLHKLAERVQAERATWPRCATCGQPCGAFPDVERSPVRALVERIFGAAP